MYADDIAKFMVQNRELLKEILLDGVGSYAANTLITSPFGQGYLIGTLVTLGYTQAAQAAFEQQEQEEEDGT